VAFVFLIAFALLSLVYSPMLTIPYAHHDQYRHFVDTVGNPDAKCSCRNDPEYDWLCVIGRPLAAALECVIFRSVRSVRDFFPFRFVCIAVLALSCTILVFLLTRPPIEMDVRIALCVALPIFLLPGVQYAVFMANMSNSVSAFLPLLSSLLLIESGRLSRSDRTLSPLSLAFVLISFGSLLLGMFAYVSWSFLFFVPTLAFWLFDNTAPPTRKRLLLLRDIAFFGLAAGLYYATVKIFLYPKDAIAGQIPEGYRVAVSLSGILPKSLSLLTEELVKVLNLWNVYPTKSVAFGVSFLVLMGFLLDGIFRPGPLWRKIERGFVALLLLVASNGIYLVSEAFFLHRIFFVFSAMVSVLFFWAVTMVVGCVSGKDERSRTCSRFVVALVLASCLFQAASTIQLNVMNSFLELELVKSALVLGWKGTWPTTVFLVVPRFGKTGFNGMPQVTDEFNVPTCVHRQHIVPMVRVAIEELVARQTLVMDGRLYAWPVRSSLLAHVAHMSQDRYRVTNEFGVVVDGVLKGGVLVVPAWKLSAKPQGEPVVRLEWENGTVWRSVRPDGQSLVGDWLVDPLPRISVYVVDRVPEGVDTNSGRVVIADLNRLYQAASSRSL